jgi:hypothetical protein
MDQQELEITFEATIYPGRKAKTKEWADDLDVDRVPDAKGRVRALITVEDCVRLLDRGLEIRSSRTEGPRLRCPSAARNCLPYLGAHRV